MAQDADTTDGTMIGLAATLAFLGAAPAHAASTTSGLGVTATILPHCSVSLEPVAFGSLDMPRRGTVDATGSLTVSCTRGTHWTASADRGAGSGASLADRRMSSGSGQLSYSLYVDKGHSRVWGDGTGSSVTVSDIGSGAAQGFRVYGRISADQEESLPGHYSDLVIVTVTY